MMYERQAARFDGRKNHSIKTSSNTTINSKSLKDSRKSRSKSNSSHNNNNDQEPERLEIVDLSGMSLETLPKPSINLAAICKLDLSNNNLEVIFFVFHIFFYTVHYYYYILSKFFFLFFHFEIYG